MALADLNGDGRDDVVVGRGSAGFDQDFPVLVWLARASGALSPVGGFGAVNAAGPLSLAAADFTGDGKTDVAVGAWSVSGQPPSPNIALLSGNGDGSLTDVVRTSALFSIPFELERADFGGDVRADLVYGPLTSPYLVFATSAGDGTFATLATYQLDAAGIGGFDLLDADHNGVTDVAATLGHSIGEAVGNDLLLQLMDRNRPVFLQHLPVPRTPDHPAAGVDRPEQARLVAAGDVNNDGWVDMVTLTGTSIAPMEETAGTLGVVLNVPGLAIKPSAVTFAPTQIGASSSAAVTLGSSGPRPVSVGDLSLTGPASADFTVTGDGCSGRQLGAADTCEIDLGFTPTAATSREATLRITGTDAAGVRTVGLSGSGVAMPGGAPTLPGLTPIRPAADRTAPQLTLLQIARQTLMSALERGLRIRVRYAERATVIARLTLASTLARRYGIAAGKTLQLGRTVLRVEPNRARTMIVRFSRRARSGLRRARSILVTVTLQATDIAGNRAAPMRRRLRLSARSGQ